MEAHFGSSHERSGIHEEPSCLRPGCNPPRKVREKMTIPLTDAFRVLHPLRLKKSLPRFARHNFHPHQTAQELGESCANLDWRHTPWSFQFDHAVTAPLFLKNFGCHPPDVRCRHHRYRFVERLKKTRNHTPLPCRSYIPATVLHEPSRTKDRKRHSHGADCLLDYPMLGKKIGLARPCPNRGKVNHSPRQRSFQCGFQCHPDGLCLRKPGQRIEIRWHHHKSSLGPSKRSRERGSIFYIGEGDFTSATSPFTTFASISHDRADWLSCSEKGASDG